MFRARHIGGPLDGDGNDVALAAPVTPSTLIYAPCAGSTVTKAGYVIVGFDGNPATYGPGAVRYVIDRDLSDLRQHDTYPEMEEGVAVYVIEGATDGA